MGKYSDYKKSNKWCYECWQYSLSHGGNHASKHPKCKCPYWKRELKKYYKKKMRKPNEETED